MIKASLNFHDPQDIYDYVKKQYGTLSMLISQNMAIMTLENPQAKVRILQNPRILIKNNYIIFKSIQEEGSNQKIHQKNNSISQVLPIDMDLQESGARYSQYLVLKRLIQNLNVKTSLQKIDQQYQAKIKQIKQNYLDSKQCDTKISQLNYVIQRNMNLIIPNIQKQIKKVSQALNRFSINPQLIVLDDYKIKESLFTNSTEYCSSDINSVKRLCLLSQNTFAATVREMMIERGEQKEKGQLRIYTKGNIKTQFSLDISEYPYSLMVHQNFLLTGDTCGQIHFIDFKNENACEFSNKISHKASYILQMKKYQNNSVLPSIITLFQTQKENFKIRRIEIEKQAINNDINSLSFHLRQQFSCIGKSSTIETFEDGKFAYASENNTYICQSFDRRHTNCVAHDHVVMKIKLKNSQELIQATEKKIFLLDLRALKLKNQIFEFKHYLNNIQMISQHQAFYGGIDGEIGIIDCRKPDSQVWKPKQTPHRKKIADILQIGQDVLVADASGKIIQWKKQQISNGF